MRRPQQKIAPPPDPIEKGVRTRTALYAAAYGGAVPIGRLPPGQELHVMLKAEGPAILEELISMFFDRELDPRVRSVIGMNLLDRTMGRPGAEPPADRVGPPTLDAKKLSRAALDAIVKLIDSGQLDEAENEGGEDGNNAGS